MTTVLLGPSDEQLQSVSAAPISRTPHAVLRLPRPAKNRPHTPASSAPRPKQIYTWVDEVPLSRPKRNITRDFSDGVLMAEVVHHFFPRDVDVKNYSAANSVRQKLYNWQTLIHKVRVCFYPARGARPSPLAHPRPPPHTHLPPLFHSPPAGVPQALLPRGEERSGRHRGVQAVRG